MKQEKKPHFPRKHLILSIISLVMVAVFSFGMVFANGYAKIINQALGLSSTKTISLAGEEESANKFVSEYGSLEEAKEADKELAERLTEEGVVLLKKTGQPVREGETLAKLYTNRPDRVKAAEKTLLESCIIGEKAPEKLPLVFDLIR